MSPFIMSKTKSSWWKDGLHFSCTQSGQCCRTNGAYAYVFMNDREVRAAAKLLKLSIGIFRKRYITEKDGMQFIKDPEQDCHFLKDKKCSIHKMKPQQCKDWPFWKESLDTKSKTIWKKDVMKICAGVRRGEEGIGKHYSAKVIENLLKKQHD
jgi:uncharacterized protein